MGPGTMRPRFKKVLLFDFFGPFSGTNPTFYYSSTKQSWTEAQSFCRQHYTDLASVRHLADNEAVQGLVQRAAWMGLYRDSWKWADGGNSSFRNWNRDEPNSDQNKDNISCMQCVMIETICSQMKTTAELKTWTSGIMSFRLFYNLFIVFIILVPSCKHYKAINRGS
uniref:C-type lectin domain-containing protein n=1 Tax=Poecilia mexicana TaxID=48701 RepID=A0A3B3WSB8_9TELE